MKTFLFILAATLVTGFSMNAHAELPIDNDTAAAMETDATGHAAEMTKEIAEKDGYVNAGKVENKDSQEQKKD
jgi:hypothetical protein